MKEYWITVKGHPDYEVSSLGQVRRFSDKRYLSQSLNKPNGYYRVYMDGRKYYTHKVVAESFFDGEHDGMDVVLHIDGNKRNNSLGNLMRCDRRNDLVKFSNTSAGIVYCKYCVFRDEDEFCTNRDDYFYCADGRMW